MREPVWMIEARRHVGLKEIPGPRHNQTIMGWIKRLGPRVLGIVVKDDETAWCGTFMAHVMSVAGIKAPPIAVRASAWGTWGRQLVAPRIGCVLVFTRKGGGHVGLYAGETDTHYAVLGGNQGNAVNIMMLAKSRLSPGGMRWPEGVPLPLAQIVRVSGSGIPLSENEA